MPHDAEVYQKDGKLFAVIGMEILPVTHLFDGYGEACGDLDDALTAVAGPDVNGLWVTIELSGPSESMN